MNKIIKNTLSKENTHKSGRAERRFKGHIDKPFMPEIRVPWKVRAIVETNDLHVAKREVPGIQSKGQPLAPIYRIDWLSLERNKFAPWGVGKNTCLYK
jgi:hypothetical protein